MPAFASKDHLIRSFNKLGDLLLTFGKQNKKPHAEQKATNDYEQAVLEPAYVQKPVNPPKPLQTTSKTPSPVTPLKVNWNTSVNIPFITQSSRREFTSHFGTQMVSCH